MYIYIYTHLYIFLLYVHNTHVYIILYYIILYYIILYYNCYIILSYIILYYVILYNITLYYIILYYIIYIILYYIILCYVMLCYVILYYIILYIHISYTYHHIISFLICKWWSHFPAASFSATTRTSASRKFRPQVGRSKSLQWPTACSSSLLQPCAFDSKMPSFLGPDTLDIWWDTITMGWPSNFSPDFIWDMSDLGYLGVLDRYRCFISYHGWICWVYHMGQNVIYIYTHIITQYQHYHNDTWICVKMEDTSTNTI